MSASGCGLNRPLAVLHEGQLWVESGRWLDPMMDWMQSPPPPQLIG
jgi:hypothetical protein